MGRSNRRGKRVGDLMLAGSLQACSACRLSCADPRRGRDRRWPAARGRWSLAVLDRDRACNRTATGLVATKFGLGATRGDIAGLQADAVPILPRSEGAAEPRP